LYRRPYTFLDQPGVGQLMVDLWNALEYNLPELNNLTSALGIQILQWNTRLNEQLSTLIQLPTLPNPLLESTPSESNYSELVGSGDLVEETVSRRTVNSL
jgi:hypothetical protein